MNAPCLETEVTELTLSTQGTAVLGWNLESGYGNRSPSPDAMLEEHITLDALVQRGS
ncbi:hypothetical protein [Pleomorphomonas sp. JP5]|uniref:hypothetical protein n=1 Tax=Pleomorphomonas sp. JP5 TaxID=2942998 RepID=UPI0020431329|nr:hypothetical protein [Pleomorphomonas sp. JP5]MCM5560169.1 hypothetical protein [Pleomorphomonas sp. JP5]